MPIIWGSPLPPDTSLASPLFGFAELALDPVTHDLAVPVRVIRGPLAVAQRVKCRLLFFLGEWVLDQRLGVPYFRDVLVKNPDPILISAIFRQVVRETPGVSRVTKLLATIDKPTRTLTVDFSAVLLDGMVVEFQDEKFILS
jgi:hypothetical protein